MIYYYCSTLRRKGEPGTSSSPHLILIYRRWEVIGLMISSFSLFSYTSLLLYIKQNLARPPHVEKMGTLIASLEERALTKGRDKKLNTQTMCKRLFGSQGVILGGFKETIFEKKKPYWHSRPPALMGMA